MGFKDYPKIMFGCFLTAYIIVAALITMFMLFIAFANIIKRGDKAYLEEKNRVYDPNHTYTVPENPMDMSDPKTKDFIEYIKFHPGWTALSLVIGYLGLTVVGGVTLGIITIIEESK